MKTSVFDRLARQGTAASNARLAEAKAIRQAQQQRRAAAAAATYTPRTAVENPGKKKSSSLPQDQSNPPKSSKLTTEQRNAVFDRLYKKSEPAGTATRPTKSQPRRRQFVPQPQDPSHARKQDRRRLTNKERDAVVNRLYTNTKPPRFLSPAKLQQPVLPRDQSKKSRRLTPKQQDALHKRLSQQETISSAAHHIHVPDGRESSIKPAKSPVKGTTTGSSEPNQVFHRLSKQETISSAAHHIRIPDGRESLIKPPKSPAKASPVFNRLYKHETASTKNHHHAKEKGTKPSPPKGIASAPPSLLKRLEAAASENSTTPPIPIKMNLHIRTKDEKKKGDIKPYVHLNLPHSDVRHRINAFHSGKISACALASDVITALFHRDFMPGTHWNIDAATVDELLLDPEPLVNDEEDRTKKTSVVKAEKQAVWDWKDVYSVASAKATIKISSRDIYVDDYSYYVAG
mmetsp:Transcript_24950/g.52245  ORF Transcript_24950/g.52245 Transcript_24950/m.52245 type:complete len:459 (+) Transcript_24950:121-1497(+)